MITTALLNVVNSIDCINNNNNINNSNNNSNNNNNNMNNNMNNNNNNFPETRKYWVDVQRGIVLYHGEMILFSLGWQSF